MTTDAVAILDKMIGDDPEQRALIEDEMSNLEVRSSSTTPAPTRASRSSSWQGSSARRNP